MVTPEYSILQNDFFRRGRLFRKFGWEYAARLWNPYPISHQKIRFQIWPRNRYLISDHALPRNCFDLCEYKDGIQTIGQGFKSHFWPLLGGRIITIILKIVSSKKMYPIVDLSAKIMPYFRPKWPNSIPFFRHKQVENHTLWGCTYQNSLCKGVPLYLPWISVTNRSSSNKRVRLRDNLMIFCSCTLYEGYRVYFANGKLFG